LIQFCISPPKSDLENNVIVSDYTQMDRVYKEERNYILNIVKKIKASGCNVLLIQKSILRDAVTELALHYLVRRFSWTPGFCQRSWKAADNCNKRTANDEIITMDQPSYSTRVKTLFTEACCNVLQVALKKCFRCFFIQYSVS